ncbi:LPXTG cell wall anchor domain-containing protein [Culicoidibacter larvae]|uniref:LPXTG cell wall anchor domain-containing protein n=2 Tax=Culicoidibacter larvae TaxID=2579976 RepID=A0A5R8QHH2_9FIRM|nr:LPXTG cell wall anchor domain-containing protein [Culicoidibacter larvae]
MKNGSRSEELIVNGTPQATPTDVEAPIISAKQNVRYIVGSAVSTDQFLSDIEAQTNDGSAITVDLSPVNWNAAGIYEVELKATDAAGNVAAPLKVQIELYEVSSAAETEANAISSDTNNSSKNNQDLPATGQSMVEQLTVGAGLIVIVVAIGFFRNKKHR